jgi:nitrate reductase NapD
LGEIVSYSGIVVRADPAGLAKVADRLNDLPGVQVHQKHPESGRVVLTLEAGTADEEVAGLRRIQTIPGVVSADLVYHRLPHHDDAEADDQSSQHTSTQRGEI